MPVIISAKAFKETHHELTVAGGAIRELMARPMVFPNRNKDVLENVERGRETLCEYVHDVVVAVGAIIEFNTKRVLPFLGFENMVRVWGVEDEPFEIELTYTAQFWPWLEGHIGIITDAIVALEKSDFGIEVWPNLAVLAKNFEPAVLVGDASSKICLAGRDAWCPRLCSEAGQDQVPVEYQSSVCTAGLIEAVKWVSGPFIDANHTYFVGVPDGI